MVHFDDDINVALFGAGVLVTDENGKTVFTGLTAAETQFVLDYETSNESINTTESDRFQALLTKFHSAREKVLSNAERFVNDQLTRYRYPHQNS